MRFWDDLSEQRGKHSTFNIPTFNYLPGY